MKWVGVLGILMMLGISISFVYSKGIERQLESYSDSLIPANDPDPPNQCLLNPGTQIPTDATIIYWGNSTSFSNQKYLSLIQVRNRELLGMDRDARGNILVNAEVFGEDKKIIVEIHNNNFTVNQNNIFKMERPDRSSLRVVDQYNRPALSVRYLNSHAIKVLGLFYSPELSMPIRIEENQQTFGNIGTFSATCLDGGGIVIN